MSEPILSNQLRERLLVILRELGRPATTDELVRLLRERTEAA